MKKIVGYDKPRKMKLALEGPINSCTDSECNGWREEVIKALGQWYTFHNPMDFDCRGRESELEQELINYDTAGIASSDVVLAMAEKASWGTAMAIQMAWSMQKKIVAVCPRRNPSPWLNNRCVVIVPTLNEGIDWLTWYVGPRFTPCSDGRFI